MTKPSGAKHSMIDQSSFVTRRVEQSGPGGPFNQRNAVQKARPIDRDTAGRFGPLAASFVNHKEATLLFPHSFLSGQNGSVLQCLAPEGLV